MEKQKIYSAFDNITLSEDSANRMLDSILSASEISPVRRTSIKPILIAAVVIVMLLTMGAVVVKLSVSDFIIGEYFIPSRPYTGKTAIELNHPEETVNHILSLYELSDSPKNNVDSEVIVPDETLEIISMQGKSDSTNQKALQEWLAFQESYDQDHTLLREADENNYMEPDEYTAYGVYTQEMIDKVDEITEKYGLKLLGARTVFQRNESVLLFDALDIKQLHREGTDADITYSEGYFYDCGAFSFNFGVSIPDSDSAVSGVMRYSVKGYFDPSFFCVDINNVEQWNYTTSDGTELLIIIDKHVSDHDEDVAWLLCDREEAFITVRLVQYSTDPNKTEPRENIEYITKSNVEYIADVIDFNVKPNV